MKPRPRLSSSRNQRSRLLWAALLSSCLPHLAFAEESTTPEQQDAKPPDSAPQPEAEDATPADPARARVDFARGTQLYESGDFRGAARAFETAHAHAPHSVALFNAAKAWEKADVLERAADDYATSIQRGELPPAESSQAQSALSRLRRNLGWIRLQGEDGVRISVGYLTSVEPPVQTHLAPGDHVVTATDANGRKWRQVVTVQPNAPLSVYVTPPQEPVPAATPPMPPSLPPPASARASNAQAQATWGFVGLGVGASLGAAAAVLGVATVSSNERYEQSEFTDRELRDETETLKLWTNVAAFSGAAIGISGIIALLTLPDDESPRTRSEADIAVTPTGVQVRGHF